MANKYLNWLIFGALTGLVLGLVAPWIIGQLVTATGIAGITFSTYNVREQLSGVAATGNPVAAWAANFIGVAIPSMWWVTALMSALGLGAAVAAVAWLYDNILGKIIEMLVPAKHKLVSILILAEVIVGIALQNQYPAFEFVALLFMLLTGILSVYIMKWIYKLTKMTLPA
jgi:hypothetical protein